MNRRQILFSSGVHFGHRCSSWSPKMAPFIWGKKDGIHLIDIAHTETQITKGEKLLEEVAAKGLPILWVGTKKVAKNSVLSIARDTESPYFIDRWVGGTLTNYHEVKKSVTNLLYNQEIIDKADRQMYTKKELNVLNKKIERATKTIGGIQKLTWPLGALVIADIQKDYVAVKEAVQAGIPIVALVDTNCNPEGIDVAIPCNDDLEKAVSVVLGFLSEAVKRGKETFKKNKPVEAEIAKTESSENKSTGSKKTFSADAKKSFKSTSKKTVKEIPTPKKVEVSSKKVESVIDKTEVIKEKTVAVEVSEKKEEVVVEAKAKDSAKEKKPVAKKEDTKKTLEVKASEVKKTVAKKAAPKKTVEIKTTEAKKSTVKKATTVKKAAPKKKSE